jgi:hypothetical protein
LSEVPFVGHVVSSNSVLLFSFLAFFFYVFFFYVAFGGPLFFYVLLFSFLSFFFYVLLFSFLSSFFYASSDNVDYSTLVVFG